MSDLSEAVKRIAELDAKRTQGDWKQRHEPPRHIIFIEASVGESALAVTAGGYYDSIDNAAFIAAAPLMAATVAQQAAIIEEQREALKLARGFMATIERTHSKGRVCGVAWVDKGFTDCLTAIDNVMKGEGV